MTDNKFILDACCSGRMFWFDKKHPNTLYIDNRKEEKGFVLDRPNFEVNPDIVMDFRDLKFPDNRFKLVVWDPPHIVRIGNKSWMSQKYGMLGKTWKADLTKGFEECWRVLEDHGILILKWSESEISCSEILKLFHTQPLFGHPTARSGTTKWLCFMKIPTHALVGVKEAQETHDLQDGKFDSSTSDAQKFVLIQKELNEPLVLNVNPPSKSSHFPQEIKVINNAKITP